MAYDHIIRMIDNFISGADVSIKLVNEIEVTLDDTFPEDPYIQEVVAMLASYLPGGGDFLYDAEEMKHHLQRTKKYLASIP